MPKLRTSETPQAKIVWPTFTDLEIEATQARFDSYWKSVLDGTTLVNKWVYAACKRHERDLRRGDIYLDWQEVARFFWHADRLKLIDEWQGTPLNLPSWQCFFFGSMVGWKWTASNTRRFKLALLQVGRGAGKTTGAAVWALYELLAKVGAMGYALANTEEQATICLDNAKKILCQLDKSVHDLDGRLDHIKSSDLVEQRQVSFRTLPAKERSLDGLNPSFWIADEAAEFSGRFLTKLLTTGAKRRESTGLIITTPTGNPESQYGEIVKNLHEILLESLDDDTFFGMLYGLDEKDALDDSASWIKANPGLPYGQPTMDSLKRAWNSMKGSPISRSEFCRYHASRVDENTGGWLEMQYFTGLPGFDESTLKSKPCWGALDLSKSGDMTVLLLAFPLGDGRVYLKGRYMWPSHEIAQRELDYRLPVRAWAADNKIELHPGREIDYEKVAMACTEACQTYSVQKIVYDAWGSHLLAQDLLKQGVPIESYKQNISFFGPGMQLFQNLWRAGKIVCSPDDPVIRRAFATCHAKADQSGNLRPVKPENQRYALIDPAVCAIMCVHAWGGTTASAYELEAAEINRDFKIHRSLV
jgi:phage terminase large subunit-like protein